MGLINLLSKNGLLIYFLIKIRFVFFFFFFFFFLGKKLVFPKIKLGIYFFMINGLGIYFFRKDKLKNFFHEKRIGNLFF